MDVLDEHATRQRIMDDVRTMLLTTNGTLTRSQLLSYQLDGVEMPLIDYSRGIRNPRQLQATLSVVSSVNGPYQDAVVVDGVWRYDYRSGSSAGDNTKLRRAKDLEVDIILFRKLAPNLYQPIFPVRVIDDYPESSYVLLSLAELADIDIHHAPTAVERAWAAAVTRRRVHQPAFRVMVLNAYGTQCTVCRFRHQELLDAAHIIGDGEDWGDAKVTNGLAMCKIHHAAYDRNFMGITPDFEIRINEALLNEVDGPMLQHGLKDMHGQSIVLPRRQVDRPEADRLASRFAEFASV